MITVMGFARYVIDCHFPKFQLQNLNVECFKAHLLHLDNMFCYYFLGPADFERPKLETPKPFLL